MTLAFSVATARDWRAYFRQPAPDIFTALIARRNGRVVGIAGVMWDDHGRAWGFMDHRLKPDEPLPAFAMHRQARRFLEVMREVGEPAIYTGADTSRSPRAEAWLRRLGFEITDEFGTVEQAIWKWPTPLPS